MDIGDTYKLNGWYNIFSDSCRNEILATWAIIFLWVFFYKEYKLLLPVFLFLNAVILIVNILNSPKKLQVFDGVFFFDGRVYVPHEFIHGKTAYKRIKIKVRYTVSEIKNLEFHQNFIGKLFDTGHISFGGKVSFESDKYLERIPEKNSFKIYGIAHFSEFKAKHSNI